MMAPLHTGVLLVLSGPLQSWGTDGRFADRHTDFEPSKSGVLGLVGAAMGMSRDDEETLACLSRLTMATRVDREGKLMRDYHTAGGGTFRGKPHKVWGTETVLSQRYYLLDAVFVVALTSEDSNLIERIAESFRKPRWPLFLGRRSCVPDRPVFLTGPTSGEAADLLRSVPWQGRRAPDYLSTREQIPEKLRCVVEVRETGEPSDGGEGRLRADVPRSFARYARSFHTRRVTDVWLETRHLPGGEHVPESASA